LAGWPPGQRLNRFHRTKLLTCRYKGCSVQEVDVSSIPTTIELSSTIDRMESVYRRQDEARALFDVYEKLCQRFEQDLADERDLLLSKAAALMMIKYSVEQTGSHPSRG
ncbi:hypothetical protein, partial [Rhizobium sophoriradicis]